MPDQRRPHRRRLPHLPHLPHLPQHRHRPRLPHLPQHRQPHRQRHPTVPFQQPQPQPHRHRPRLPHLPYQQRPPHRPQAWLPHPRQPLPLPRLPHPHPRQHRHRRHRFVRPRRCGVTPSRVCPGSRRYPRSLPTCWNRPVHRQCGPFRQPKCRPQLRRQLRPRPSWHEAPASAGRQTKNLLQRPSSTSAAAGPPPRQRRPRRQPRIGRTQSKTWQPARGQGLGTSSRQVFLVVVGGPPTRYEPPDEGPSEEGRTNEGRTNEGPSQLGVPDWRPRIGQLPFSSSATSAAERRTSATCMFSTR